MIAQIDGYLVAERLLEGVMFDVHLDERPDGDVVLVKVTDPPSDADYLRGINTAHWRSQIEKLAEDNLSHLRSWARGEGKTLVEVFDEWEASGEDRGDLLMEV